MTEPACALSDDSHDARGEAGDCGEAARTVSVRRRAPLRAEATAELTKRGSDGEKCEAWGVGH
jgi:hypothetical protein